MTPIRRACLALLWLLVVACGTEDVGQSDSTLHRGLGTDPESLDAQKARSVQAANVLRDIGEGSKLTFPSSNTVPGEARFPSMDSAQVCSDWKASASSMPCVATSKS